MIRSGLTEVANGDGGRWQGWARGLGEFALAFERQRYGWPNVVLLASFALGVCLSAISIRPASAQIWDPGGANITVVPRQSGGETPTAEQAAPPVSVQLVAQLTADGQRIEDGLVWRIYEPSKTTQTRKPRLISTHRDSAPIVRLQPGAYMINVGLGKAHLTRRITIDGGTPIQIEQFVINAGGLRVKTAGDEGTKAITYNVFSDRDQSFGPKLVLGNMKPGVVIRLNAGIYQIVSKYGDANAKVTADVTVEAGKLTEVTLTHSAATATFKLVERAGGEALPDTQWFIRTPDGLPVKESVGALPTHILAPGTYSVVARSRGREFQRDFSLKDGETTQVEVIMR